MSNSSQTLSITPKEIKKARNVEILREYCINLYHALEKQKEDNKRIMNDVKRYKEFDDALGEEWEEEEETIY